MSVSLSFAWYDLWIGAYWSRSDRVLYICPLPCLLVRIARRKEPPATCGGVGKCRVCNGQQILRDAGKAHREAKP